MCTHGSTQGSVYTLVQIGYSTEMATAKPLNDITERLTTTAATANENARLLEGAVLAMDTDR